MDKNSRDKKFIRKPTYPGGEKALFEFVKSQLSYPKDAIKNKVEGTVQLRYDINYKGIVTAVKVISSLSKTCDQEAIRIVKLLKFEIPKGPRKIKVLFHKTIRINFKISKVVSKKMTKKPTQNIQYNIVPSTKKDESTSSGYSYTINI